MIQFDCETCFQEYKVRDDRAGQTLKCKSCGSRMRVPAAGAGDSEDFEEEYVEPVRPRRKKNTGSSKQKKSKGGSNATIYAIGAGVGLLVVIGLGLLLFRGKDPGQNNVAGNGGAGNVEGGSAETGTAASGGWVSLVDPPRKSTNWTADPQLSIDLKDLDEKFIVPNVHTPFIGLKGTGQNSQIISVWNLATGKEVNVVNLEIPDKKYYYDLNTKISFDGKYLLTTAKDPETKISKLAVFNVSTGKLVSEWEAGTAGAHINGYKFSGPSTVLAKTLKKENNSFTSILKSWDFKSGKLIKEVLLKSNSNDFNTYNYQITPGGKYLISVSFQTVSVYDLSSLELVKKIELLELLKAADPGNIVSRSLSVTEKAISDDGKELALLMKDLNGTSLWTLNLKDGSVVNELYFPGDLYDAFSEPGYLNSKLTWSPEGKGWLLYGAIFVDRQRKQVTWALKPVPNVISRARILLTPDSLVTQTASAMRDADGKTLYNRKPFLVTVPLPLEEIQQTLAAYDKRSEAYLGAGQQVSLEVNVGNIKFGKPDEVKSILSDVITQRLKTEGFLVANDQPTVFKIEYQEQAGNTLQLAKSVKPSAENPLGRVATGKTLETTAAIFELSWIDQKTQKTLWSKKVAINPQVLYLREATAEGARTEMFENLQSRLRAEFIPYFIPKDDKLKMLPFEITLPE
ncbi:WD40 repeat domain-containing protein [Gimesia algae]|uniref:Uncharacterized protein n=1 Tax=Gimesia algae TaxID=2527971 RepID=A0A517VJ03_9PLAN|nr:WD40 repeat domain-containing protein [Gimesia algae]QDT92979.1 hypothetical protein Pan161_46510 [Gimesia algae]